MTALRLYYVLNIIVRFLQAFAKLLSIIRDNLIKLNPEVI